MNTMGTSIYPLRPRILFYEINNNLHLVEGLEIGMFYSSRMTEERRRDTIDSRRKFDWSLSIQDKTAAKRELVYSAKQYEYYLAFWALAALYVTNTLVTTPFCHMIRQNRLWTERMRQFLDEESTYMITECRFENMPDVDLLPLLQQFPRDGYDLHDRARPRRRLANTYTPSGRFSFYIRAEPNDCIHSNTRDSVRSYIP